ncbi:MAG: hypothetical protein KZQ64_12350 [gamma proteobacterium symbiont of Bathyaustriella thionipta]|nr:hypothetical protein [gamma proteobacterium symbiont of Bathyaustriella thionipta]MCU7950531.1 hypothetical protein [gamma proteobacterium symbiont of Bathyaustriella thionipta]MCU7954163.1 hypothetical protein [gamma proteobacterium symbiont of Bathyaustriella thionipta]MCU7957019.1 hypothetical protein [gamma proteobacterium symbiont of Bathyaustriella thionipta]MCU7968457.1 hypothetical protein [gamma proteobacterium symbiont of Bathyaustriella thionipta]
MKISHLFLLVSLFFPIITKAQLWSFTTPVDVTHGIIDKVYHHLESAGRRNIAVSSGTVAVVWEDNRNGNPTVYLALKNKNEPAFSAELKISGSGEAFEPSIVALTGNRFAVSWEEDSKVFVRVINTEQLASPILAGAVVLPAKEAMQSSITANGHQLFITFSKRAGRYSHIRLIQLEVNQQDNLSLLKNCIVDPDPVKDEQLYPTAVLVDGRIMVAWEDRRMGHTIIMGTLSQVDDICQFPSAQRISKRQGQPNLPYGKGHGVSRVAMGQYGKSNILAAWADKRNFREGYDIYSAVYDKTWGSNSSVQDEFGGVARQWHTAVAGHSNGYRIVVWTDERENNSDVFYSWIENDEWSEDNPLPGASGIGEQTHPSIVFDDDGNIHIAWILRKEVGGTTRLKYSLGRISQTDK